MALGDSRVADEKEAAPAPKVKASPKIDDAVWSAAVATWLDTCMRGSPVAQSTEAWNHLNTHLPTLRKLLERER